MIGMETGYQKLHSNTESWAIGYTSASVSTLDRPNLEQSLEDYDWGKEEGGRKEKTLFLVRSAAENNDRRNLCRGGMTTTRRQDMPPGGEFATHSQRGRPPAISPTLVDDPRGKKVLFSSKYKVSSKNLKLNSAMQRNSKMCDNIHVIFS